MTYLLHPCTCVVLLCLHLAKDLHQPGLCHGYKLVHLLKSEQLQMLCEDEATPMLKKIKPAFCIGIEEDTQDFLMGRCPYSHTSPSLNLFLHCWTILHNAKLWPYVPEL